MEQKKSWFYYYEKVIDNVIKIFWLILLIDWVITSHKI